MKQWFYTVILHKRENEWRRKKSGEAPPRKVKGQQRTKKIMTAIFMAVVRA